MRRGRGITAFLALPAAGCWLLIASFLFVARANAVFDALGFVNFTHMTARQDKAGQDRTGWCRVVVVVGGGLAWPGLSQGGGAGDTEHRMYVQ